MDFRGKLVANLWPEVTKAFSKGADLLSELADSKSEKADNASKG